MKSAPTVRRLCVVGALAITSAATSACASVDPARESSVHGARGGAQPVWLCRPDMENDPCAAPAGYQSIAGDGQVSEETLSTAANPGVDCFYVYPTVSTESGENANLKVQAAETDVARDQASPFSTVCNVWAPMYKQVTLGGLFKVADLKRGSRVAFTSLISAWRSYLASDNDGRPFVLIGHSQGAAMLIRLIQTEIDPNPSLRRRMVSAIILGGNVTVAEGKEVGGSFEHVPACTSVDETGCVIAYSSFLHTPPRDSLFGRPGVGVSALSGQAAMKGLRVLCVNPALPGGSATIRPLFPMGSGDSTQWVTYPGLYSAHCETHDGATLLQVDVHRATSDDRPVVTQSLGPEWGLHLYDVNLTMLDLLAMVGDQIAAFHS